jgi:hypothetical protein
VPARKEDGRVLAGDQRSLNTSKTDYARPLPPCFHCISATLPAGQHSYVQVVRDNCRKYWIVITVVRFPYTS